MYWLKSCPKCGGDLAETWEPDARLENELVMSCIQCGKVLRADGAAALAPSVRNIGIYSRLINKRSTARFNLRSRRDVVNSILAEDAGYSDALLPI